MIEFRNIVSKTDKEYVQKLLQEDVVKKYIGDISITEYTKIIDVDSSYFGIVHFYFYQIIDAIYCEPLIYIKHRSIYSHEIIFKAINYIFGKKGVQSVIFKVFSDNRIMVNMMSILNILNVGKIEDVSEDYDRDLYIYKLDRSNYEKMVEDYSNYV
ncbi:hypothetical protein [Ligilactobacillus apodemi]|uniref:hypothetical protein n=1 Tax=Ligilactobacillus apodemi TaxID=307126 RepID=UPI00214AFFAE|nr:hypothetical protein [Ligilactobacillus apodemi]MCR1901401.1 hypothetical protein [Ligilactobacillus apodemi]